MSSLRYLVLAQISFFSLLFLCTILLPGEFMSNGISYFGVHQPTVFPYSLAFVLCAFWIERAALALPPSPGRLQPLRPVLHATALLTLSILFFPYSFSPLFHAIHVGLSIVLFVTEFLTSIWICLVSKRPSVYAYFTLELGFGLLSAVSLPHLFALEALGEAGFQFFFMCVMQRFLRTPRR